MNLIVEFARYNALMNERILDACRGLTADQLDATVEGTYGTTAATLVHLANSQEGYASSFFGVREQDGLPAYEFPGFDRLAAHLAASQARLDRAAALAADDGERIQVTGDDPPGTWSLRRSLLLMQVVVHGTEHRSQIATTLTQLGVEPPDLEAWTFFFAAGHMVEV